MASLVLGPILRQVQGDAATVWVETDRACEVGVLGSTARTFCVEGHHFALIAVSGLEPGVATPYDVRLDGEVVWPEEGSDLPPCTIRSPLGDEETKVVFGSCRVSLPHEPPWTLHQSQHPEAQGVDALRAFALRLIRHEERTPDCLLMLGDQIYADDLSPRLQKALRGRRSSGALPPEDELADFGEYCLAYQEAWSEPVIRWLLSTVPVAMIFDDHEVHAQWKISAAWQRRLEANEWYEDHISGALMAYWLYQHVGNLALAELDGHPLLDGVRERGRDGDAAPFLRQEMAHADRQAGHSRWSYYRDLGESRLIVVDSRAGRILDPKHRRMVNDEEWDWIVEQAKGDYRHLLLASSIPFFLAPGLHYAELFDAMLADHARSRPLRWLGEWIRTTAVMDHWAGFPQSFGRLVKLLGAIATGEHGEGTAPDCLLMLSGDVHHCYLAEVELTEEPAAESRIWQAVCSAYRKDLAPREKRLMRFGNSRAGERLARRLARIVRAPEHPVRWELREEPSYENQVGCLTLGRGSARVRVETTTGSDWRDPDLQEVFEHELVR